MPRTKKRVRAPRGPMPPGSAPVIAKFERMCKRYTQVGVAARADVSIQTVCDVANGRRAPAGKLLAWLGYELRYARVKAERMPVPPENVTTVTNSGDTAAAGPDRPAPGASG